MHPADSNGDYSVKIVTETGARIIAICSQHIVRVAVLPSCLHRWKVYYTETITTSGQSHLIVTRCRGKISHLCTGLYSGFSNRPSISTLQYEYPLGQISEAVTFHILCDWESFNVIRDKRLGLDRRRSVAVGTTVRKDIFWRRSTNLRTDPSLVRTHR